MNGHHPDAVSRLPDEDALGSGPTGQLPKSPTHSHWCLGRAGSAVPRLPNIPAVSDSSLMGDPGGASAL